MQAEESRLDGLIRERQEALRSLEEDEYCRRYMFMTEEDITSLPRFQNQTLLAIKAPTASYIEVPDPDEVMSFPQRQYRMVIRSRMGPIDVYLLSKYKGDSGETSDKLGHESDQNTLSGVDTPSLKIVTSDTDLKADYWFESEAESCREYNYMEMKQRETYQKQRMMLRSAMAFTAWWILEYNGYLDPKQQL